EIGGLGQQMRHGSHRVITLGSADISFGARAQTSRQADTRSSHDALLAACVPSGDGTVQLPDVGQNLDRRALIARPAAPSFARGSRPRLRNGVTITTKRSTQAMRAGISSSLKELGAINVMHRAARAPGASTATIAEQVTPTR